MSKSSSSVQTGSLTPNGTSASRRQAGNRAFTSSVAGPARAKRPEIALAPERLTGASAKARAAGLAVPDPRQPAVLEPQRLPLDLRVEVQALDPARVEPVHEA